MRRAPVASLLLAALVVAACGGATTPSGAATSPAASGSAQASRPVASAGGPSTGVESTAPSIAPGSPEPTVSGAASPSPDASASTSPTDLATPAPSASAGAGPAGACSGSADNRAFYANLAASVSWDVFCAVLPKGWSVSAGSYRLANGGKLVISYKGPSGASLTLSEGSFCTDASGCVPSGSDTGAAAFGSMTGTLVTTDAGGFAIVASRGQTPSWLMVTGGLDQATTTALGAALALVH
jgi:hypothetical protein